MPSPMPPHGKAYWNGELTLPPVTEARSIFTGEKHNPTVEVGMVILADPANEALNPGRTGMVVGIDPDPETGEVVYTVLATRKIRNRTEAWTFTMPASEVNPTCLLPDSFNGRHGYATGCLRAAADGRWVTPEGYRLAGIGLSLVRDCLWGGKAS